MFAGALCSSDPEYGPKLVLDHMQGDEGWWDDIDHVMGFSRMTAGLWGLLELSQGRHGIPLHAVELSDPPTVAELRQIVWTREREYQRFQEGMGLSAKPGDDLDPQAKEAAVDFAKAKLGLKAIDRALRRAPPSSPEALRAVRAELEQLSLEMEDFYFRMGALGRRLREERLRREPPIDAPHLPCHCGSGKLGGACCLRVAPGPR